MRRLAALVFLLGIAPALAQNGPFGSGLFEVFEKADCRACHNPDGVASPTRLHFPALGAAPERVDAFGRSLVTLIDRVNPDASLLLNKPTNRIPHAGGARIAPGSDDEAILRGWITTLTRLSGVELESALKYREEEAAGDGHDVPKPEFRRLTHSQYNHTVRDLLGEQTAPANRFPPDDFVDGFRNQYESQSLSPLLIEAYSAAAERLAANAFRGGDTHGLIPCNEATAVCRARFVREFGLKAFRRPLEPSEQRRFQELMAGEEDLIQGAQLVLEVMLQSTSFLFRLEDSFDPRWIPYAAASALSYAIWDTTPDVELLAAAARGDLQTPEGVAATTRRMLDSPRAKESLSEFVSQWLRFDRILQASKDRRRYPQFTREMAVAMTEEARLFVNDLVWGDRNFMDVFTADYGYPNGELAPIYSVPAPANEFDRTVFPAGSERAGLLGQALFLAITAKPDDSAPTARGLFVREQFLCQHVPEPPAGVNTNLPPITEAKPQTNRDRMSEHVTNPSCATCHKLIDPIGFGLERFDAIGARRETFQLQFVAPRPAGGDGEREVKTVDLDIDPAGYVAGLPASEFTSPSQLGAVLAKSEQCQECVVKQYFRYAFGRMETLGDRPMIGRVGDAFRNSGFRFRELIVALMRERASLDRGEATHVASNHQAR
ncbi:MAG: DUF1592 domain-containing protein [Acidobacteria bacterium]|nr:DUF1592 domain-containing protein [Acidobacteriota bacterium]